MTNQQARVALTLGIEQQISDLGRLDGGKRRVELMTFFSLWVVGIACVRASDRLHPAFFPVGVVLIALALNAFVLLLHEGMHRTLFSNPKLNDGFSVMLGCSVGISYTAYKIMHLQHHAFLGDHRDPDDYENYTNSPRLLWALHGMRVAVGSLLYLVLIPFKAWKIASRPQRQALRREYQIIVLTYSTLFLSLPLTTLWKFHFASVLLVGAMVNLRGFTQHSLAVPEDPFLASRSIHAHPVVSFLLLNENLHLEHHLFPEVPSYNLGQLHQLIWSRLPRAVKNDSYSEFLLASLKAAPRLDNSPIGVVELD